MVSSEKNNNQDIDAEILSLKQELLDHATTNDRLAEINDRAKEISGFPHDVAEEPPASLQSMTDDELKALISNPSTPPEVISEIQSLAEARNAATETLPTEEQ